ncbi:MAG TPA: sigma-70 family RNA polymerase sigma factor [Tepidisphaeraceae bacterium]|jgi:RNA polymerase sigma-70 factor (ECF subfamily)
MEVVANPSLSGEAACATTEPAELLLFAERARVLAYVKRHLPPELQAWVDPNDILQDSYFEAFRRLAQFRATDDSSAYRWLVTIARHRIAQLLRMRRAARRGGGAEHAAQGASIVAMLAELASHRRTPSRSAARHEFMAALEQSLNRLPPDLGKALSLRYLQGLSPGEIAGQMGRSERAIHMLCNRALKVVRRDLRSVSMYLLDARD